jgi:hypothetical protein
MSFLDPKRTLLGAIFPATLPAAAFDRAWRLFSEAALVAAISVYLPVMLGLEHAGMISVFLAAVALSDRLTLILEENRRNIRVFRRGGWSSNRITASAILVLFLGMFVSYAVVGYAIGETGAHNVFAFTSQLAGVEIANLLEHDFGSVDRILLQNLAVIVAIAFLAFLYRPYGVMLVLAWNACVWGFVFASLATAGSQSSVFSTASVPLIAYIAVLPHLLLESASYILVSLACLFASKAVETYAANDRCLHDVIPAVATLMACGLGCLLVGALAEAYFAPLAFTPLR